MQLDTLRARRGLASIFVSVTALATIASPPAARASVYPPGGGAFTADAEGWQVSGETCNIALTGVCSASGGHDSEAGNPPGSLAADTVVTLNAGGLFESAVVFESPDFTVVEGGPATVRLDRQFEPGGLLALAPEATYAVDLIDRGAETSTQVLTETLDEGDASFAGRSAAVQVTAGRTYALSLEADIGSTTASVGLLGDAIARFDNVSLSTEAAGEGGSGSGGATASTLLSSSELRTLAAAGAAPSGRRRGRHFFVRVRCPRRARHACMITAQGRLGRRVAVTWRRTIRVGKGRTRLVALRVKARFRETVAARRRLLVVQRVRVGKVATTFARSRALIWRR